MDICFLAGGGVIEDYFWASSLCILGSFLKVKVLNGNIFGGARISNNF